MLYLGIYIGFCLVLVIAFLIIKFTPIRDIRFNLLLEHHKKSLDLQLQVLTVQKRQTEALYDVRGVIQRHFSSLPGIVGKKTCSILDDMEVKK